LSDRGLVAEPFVAEGAASEPEWQDPFTLGESRVGELSRSGAPVASVAGGFLPGSPEAPGYGSLPWFGFESFELSDDTVAKVNLANGNLFVSVRDHSVRSGPVSVAVDRYYNGLDAKAWLIGDDGVMIDGHDLYGSVPFQGANGFRVSFPWEGATWGTPSGFNATLEDTNNSSADLLLTVNGTGESMLFHPEYDFERAWHIDRNGFSVDPAQTPALAYVRGSTGSVDSITDSAGREVAYTWSSNLTGVSYPDGSAASYTYDGSGRLASITLPGPSGDPVTTTFGYDSSSRVTSVTRDDFSDTWGPVADTSTTFSYASGSTVVTDANSHASTYVIDVSGRVASVADPLGHIRSQTWTANSQVATRTDAFASGSTPGNQSTYTYDSRGNMTNAQIPTGAAAQALYGAGVTCGLAGSVSGPLDQPSCAVDAGGNTQHLTYDSLGNPMTATDVTPGGTGVTGQAVTREDALGSVCNGEFAQICTVTDGNGNTTSYTYDGYGNIGSSDLPGPLEDVTYTYDALNRVSSVTDGNGETTSYTYDAADRILTTTYENGDTVESFWNDSGTLAAQVDAGSNMAVSYEYDSSGRQTAQTIETIGAPSPTSVVTYQYDAMGNLTSFTNAAGTTVYGYDAANELTSVKEPGGTCPSSGIPAAGSGCTLMQYDVNGAESTRIFPGGATVQSVRDGAGRPTQILAKDAAGEITVDIGYSYSVSGNDRTTVQTRTSTKEQGIAAGAVTTYAYDSLNRLIAATETDGTATLAAWAYAYDDAGNRTSQTRAGATGAPAGTTGYTYNAANELTSSTDDTVSWTYDAAGNQTRHGITGAVAVFGDRSQAIQLGSETQTYVGQGNAFRIASGTSTYTPTALGLTQSTGVSANTYVRTPAGALIGYASTSHHYYVLDALGSVVGMFDSAGLFEGGYSYSPFGEARSTSTATAVTQNPLRYIGGQLDASGLYKFGARYYDPSLARFNQMDPSGQEANPYAYAASDPINNADPTGLDFLGIGADDWISIAWVVLGLAGGPEDAILLGIVSIFGDNAIDAAYSLYASFIIGGCAELEGVVAGATGYDVTLCR
jgi:RHS repeat-associated protein